ncbi:unnamed protein product [Ambrosiozyma monospora]|uniref:Unnamed protein product n=1 Tax=Ambrosiozyma monospora TaxID=43982 RepID=A0A9W6YZY6_AMBMO|nr:unnamed protein product [Ambrosiozyma monospora]
MGKDLTNPGFGKGMCDKERWEDGGFYIDLAENRNIWKHTIGHGPWPIDHQMIWVRIKIFDKSPNFKYIEIGCKLSSGRTRGCQNYNVACASQKIVFARAFPKPRPKTQDPCNGGRPWTGPELFQF